MANRAHLSRWMPWADQDEQGTATFVHTVVSEASEVYSIFADEWATTELPPEGS